jgi:hypothetical protein
MGIMNKKKIKKLWKKLNKERTILTIIALLLFVYLMRMVVLGIYYETKEYNYVDYEGQCGQGKACGIMFNGDLYCKRDGVWIPVQTYWEE